MLYTNIIVLSGMLFHGQAISPPQVSMLGCPAHSSVLDSVPPEDSTVLLTADVMTRMTTFWHRFQREPDSIRTTGQNASQETLDLYSIRSNLGNAAIKKRVVDMRAMATRYPSVATELAKAGFTAGTWNSTRRALYLAIVLGGMSFTKGSEASDSSNTGNNIRFLASHTKQLDDLRATGMWIPDPAQVEDGLKQMTSRVVNGRLQDIVLP